jgi:hypothetical protein
VRFSIKSPLGRALGASSPGIQLPRYFRIQSDPGWAIWGRTPTSTSAGTNETSSTVRLQRDDPVGGPGPLKTIRCLGLDIVGLVVLVSASTECRILAPEFPVDSEERRKPLDDRALGASVARDKPALGEGAGKRSLRAILKTVWLYSLALWTYTAAVAIADPDRVSERFLLVRSFPRTDTLGTIAFGVSALSFVFLRGLRRMNTTNGGVAQRFFDAVLGAIALYGFLGWVYIAGNVIENPSTLPLRLTHLATRPTESQFGARRLCLLGETSASENQSWGTRC